VPGTFSVKCLALKAEQLPAGLHIVTNVAQLCSAPSSFILCSERIAKSALPDGDLAMPLEQAFNLPLPLDRQIQRDGDLAIPLERG